MDTYFMELILIGGKSSPAITSEISLWFTFYKCEFERSQFKLSAFYIK